MWRKKLAQPPRMLCERLHSQGAWDSVRDQDTCREAGLLSCHSLHSTDRWNMCNDDVQALLCWQMHCVYSPEGIENACMHACMHACTAPSFAYFLIAAHV